MTTSIRLREVSLAVADLDGAVQEVSEVLDIPVLTREIVAVQPVSAEYVVLDAGNSVGVAIMKSMSQGDAIDRFIKRRGSGLFSITLEVPDIELATQRVRDAGYSMVLDQPLELPHYNTGFGSHEIGLVNFVSPLPQSGVLIEFQEFPRT